MNLRIPVQLPRFQRLQFTVETNSGVLGKREIRPNCMTFRSSLRSSEMRFFPIRFYVCTTGFGVWVLRRLAFKDIERR